MGTEVLIGRRGVGPGWLVVWLALIAVVGIAVGGLGVGSGGVAVCHRNASLRSDSARRGLSGLRLAAQGAGSGALGVARRCYRGRARSAGVVGGTLTEGLRPRIVRDG